MAEPRDRNAAEQYSETRDPKNPPNSVVQPEVGRATRWGFLLPLVVLTVVAGLLWVFWLGQPPRVRSAEETGPGAAVAGTSGERTPGGNNPDPKYDRTEKELKFRGVGTSGEGPRLRTTRQ
jgi:hypothetical protein